MKILLYFIALIYARPIETLFNENKINEAKTICSQYESLNPNDWKDLFDCSWLYLYGGETEKAILFMEKLSKQSSSQEYKLLEALSFLKKKKITEATRIVNAIRTSPINSEIAIKADIVAALIYEEENNLPAAGFIYKQLAKNRNFGIAQWGTARYYLSRQEYERAKKYLIETARIWPTHLASRYNLAIIALNEDRFKEAAKWLTECYKINKNDPDVLESLGNLFERKNLTQEAVKYWKKSLSLNSKSKTVKEKIAKYSLSLIDKLIDQKKYKEALEEINSLKVKNTPEISLRLGIVYRNLGKFDDALKELLVFHKNNPNDPRVLRELGIIYLNLKLYDKATSFFIEAISLEAHNGMNYAWLGWTMEALGEFEKAEEAWQKAVELLKDPSELAKATRKLATVQEKVKKMKKK